MKIYTCSCGQPLFFENSRCLSCDSELGFCTACNTLTPLTDTGNGKARCGNPACGAILVKCTNYSKYNVCNRCIVAPGGEAPSQAYCDCCRYNLTIPDLHVAGNLDKWYRLEVAKRRLFYDLELLNLPHGTASEGFEPPLSFHFKDDVIPAFDFWRSMGPKERVYTGHADGHITINIREADEVERERLRVDMGEAHRTLIGHFRHEIGHYYWEILIKGWREAEFTSIFGDPYHPDYATALENYYGSRARPDWAESHVSAYASMHPWEDWAETFAMYLDMVSALETAVQIGFLPGPWFKDDDLDWMVGRYQRLGIGLNEMSRTLGLLDMVPEIMVAPVVEKLRFVHSVCRDVRSEQRQITGGAS